MAKGTASRGLYKRVMGLKNDENEKDPECPGLRYVARELSGGRVAVYGQLRYPHPLTGKDTTLNKLGRVPSLFELEAEALARLEAIEDPEDSLGRVSTSMVPDYHAFESIRRKAREKLALVRSGVDPKGLAGPQGVTVEQAIEQHLSEPRDKPHSPKTVSYYGKIKRLYLGPLLKAPLRKLDGPTILKLRAELHSAHGPSVAAATLRVLKAAWGTARFHDAKLGPFPVMPKGATSGGPAKKAAIKPSELPQWFAELAKVKSAQRRDLYLLGVMTALRANDLKTIRREHFNPKSCTLIVPKPKGGKAFELPLSDAACALVARVLRSHNSDWLWPSARSKSGYLEHADPQPGDGFSIPWTLHDLRRMWASAAAAVVTNGYHLKALMNHALPARDVTAGYIELEPDDLRPSQQAVTGRLKARGLPL